MISIFNRFELTPNCLLTRYPIVFLSNERKFPGFFPFWNMLPNFLYQHGYQIVLLDSTYRLTLSNPSSEYSKAISIIENYIQDMPYKKIHLIVDKNSYETINIYKTKMENLASNWNKIESLTPLNPVDYKKTESCRCLLKYIQHLAEEDFINNT